MTYTIHFDQEVDHFVLGIGIRLPVAYVFLYSWVCIPSVLDGVLPLHVASSRGNDLVVTLLSTRHGGRHHQNLFISLWSSTYISPFLGVSMELVRISPLTHSQSLSPALLRQTPRHLCFNRITPEMLARENSKESTADLLKGWAENKDRNLSGRLSRGMRVGVGHVADQRTSCIGPPGFVGAE
jgi:hypothetical protein